MRETVQHDASDALRSANLDCRYVVIQVVGTTRLCVETAGYADAARVLADAGLVLGDSNPVDSMTFATIYRARVSKR